MSDQPQRVQRQPGAEELLRVEGLQVRFPVRNANARIGDLLRRKGPVLTQWVHAVENVSFSVGRGETLGLVGESGSGKSTIGNAIMRLVPAASGSVTLNGEDLLGAKGARLRALRRRVAMVFQDPLASLDPRRPIDESIADPLHIHGLHRGRTTERVAELLNLVGLPQRFIGRYPHELSGGQRQRVCIARALACEPDLIILDEATASLDVSVQAQVMNLLKRLQRELGLSFIFIAHDLAVVEYMSDRVMVLYLGRTMEVAAREALYAGPAHPYTRALMSAIPAEDPIAERNRTRILLTGDVPSPLNPPSGCVFRTRCPHAIDACAEVVPPMEPVGEQHTAACIRVHELATSSGPTP